MLLLLHLILLYQQVFQLLELNKFLKEFGFALLDKSTLQRQKLLLLLLLHLFLLYQQAFLLLVLPLESFQLFLQLQVFL